MGSETHNLNLDAENFNKMMNHLANDLKVPIRKVIRGECEGVLTRGSQLTGAGSKTTIEKRYKLKGRDSEWGKQKEWPFKWQYGPKQDPYLVPYVYLGSKKIKTRKIAKKDLPAVKAELKRLMTLKKARVGLAKATFLILGRKLALKPKVKKNAMNASRQSASYNATCKTKEKTEGDQGYTIELDVNNHLAGAKNADMATAFNLAMLGRVNFYKTNLIKKVFEETDKMKAKYGFATS